MIINTGCRTDIPAFYSKWFINRIREGYVLVRNPYYEDRVTKYVFNTKEVIKNSDLLVAECSSNSTGQGIEIGWADSFNIPILCIYKTGSFISSSLKFITNNIISYNSLDEFLECISNFILDGGQNGQRKVFSFYLFNYKR